MLKQYRSFAIQNSSSGPLISFTDKLLIGRSFWNVFLSSRYHQSRQVSTWFHDVPLLSYLSTSSDGSHPDRVSAPSYSELRGLSVEDSVLRRYLWRRMRSHTGGPTLLVRADSVFHSVNQICIILSFFSLLSTFYHENFLQG